MIATIRTKKGVGKSAIQNVMQTCPHTISAVQVVMGKNKTPIEKWADSMGLATIPRRINREYGKKAIFFLYSSIVDQCDLVVFIGQPETKVDRHILSEAISKQKHVWIKQ